MEQHIETHEKNYFILNLDNTKLFVTNRPSDRVDEVEYTDKESNARRFSKDDFDIIKIDRSKHKLFAINKIYTTETNKKAVPFDE